MNIGVDAAALGMSNAVTSSTNDVNAGYWNPAGLVNLKDQQVALMHANYFANIAKYDYIAYASPIDDDSAIGVDDILNTTQLIDNQGNIDYNRVSLFSTADYGFTISYARRTKTPGLQYGINTKVIRRIIGKFATANGFGFDAAIQYERKNWKFGLMIRDITTTYNIWKINETEYKKVSNAVADQNQELPERSEITAPLAQLGISRKFIIKKDYSLLAATNFTVRSSATNDIVSSKYASIDPAAGFEFGYTNLVFVRAGVGNFQNVEQLDSTKKVQFQPNMGIGFKYKGIQVDYALTNLAKQNTTL